MKDIKKIVKESKIPQWKIAAEVGVSEFTLIRWLRMPEKLEEQRTTQISEAVKKLSEGRR
jgi:transposase